MPYTIKVNGGCYFGHIKFLGELSSNKIMACDRTDCQKFIGAPFRAVAVIAADDMKISSTVTEFLKIAKNGNEGCRAFAANMAVIVMQLILPKRCL